MFHNVSDFPIFTLGYLSLSTEHHGSWFLGTEHHGSWFRSTEHHGSWFLTTEHHKFQGTEHLGSWFLGTKHHGSWFLGKEHQGSWSLGPSSTGSWFLYHIPWYHTPFWEGSRDAQGSGPPWSRGRRAASPPKAKHWHKAKSEQVK